MINIVWLILISIGIIYGICTNNTSTINSTIIDSTKISLDMLFKIFPVIALWMGLMKIAETSKLLEKLSNKISPFLIKIFPDIPESHESFSLIASNIIANLFGLGSAATPFGLKAMEELQKLNDDKKTASTSMITFLVLNTSGVTIVPTTILALRKATGSSDPTKVLPLCIMATTASTIGGLTLDYFIRRKNGNK